ncbi:MAG TPA: hypothetical protein VNY24_04910 [Candidatus Acidoferrales bacterium]|nr:hypothetical protein [Candidatus Acidoferrales bacterium]
MKYLIFLALILFAQQPTKPPESRGIRTSTSSQISKQPTGGRSNDNSSVKGSTPPAGYAQTANCDNKTAPADQDINIQRKLVRYTRLLVVAGFITALVIGWQSWETRKAAEAARQSILLTHRPKLIVRNVVSPQLETLHPLASVEDLVRSNAGDQFEGYFQVANVGNTPAVIQSIHDHIFVGNGLPMERQYSSNRIDEISLAAGESRRIELTPVNVPYETQGVIVREQINVYVIGLIAYTDGLGIRRETAFCRRLDRALQRLVPVQDNDYEYAD